MTNGQLLRRYEALQRAAQRAHDSYSRTRGARKSKGGRIESVTETRARCRRDEKMSSFQSFHTANRQLLTSLGHPTAEINYR